ncbi:hypothetical protein L6R52_19825 [Myxococcota bacterium]|nr:hypothetical protein [Myxococcota bacterium]
MTDFVFALCTPGAERVLKEEVERRRFGWAPSYQREGFVTFKRPDGAAAELPDLTFAREVSVSVGRFASPWEPRELNRGFDVRAIVRVSPRVPELAETAREVARLLGAERPRTPVEGDEVVEVVVTGTSELFVGRHVHGPRHAIHAGGLWPTELPPEAPSRAYHKIQAVLAWAGLSPAPGELAVEIGSAPGGTSWALLERGLEVLGVDPNVMDPRVLAHPKFRQLAESVRRMEHDKLPPHADWLLADMNIAPRLTLEAASWLVEVLEPRAVILTLKLKDYALASKIPTWTKQARAWGYPRVRTKQLSPHGQEIALVAER